MTGALVPSGSHPDEHVPMTPAWTCDSCGEEWPCPTKRTRLLREYAVDRASLSVYLGSCLAVATTDLYALPVTSLQDRFIGWVPRRPLTS
ncbi:hypothetical protein ABZ807_04660 [Micromonospora sp. NPDC047548]|uniref:hypothetical protein n=1 Tax=Micromonospora sp. NPDC047548 TaxID=3155624 RepID=UPI0033FC1E92